jgi:hypothetical protein
MWARQVSFLAQPGPLWGPTTFLRLVNGPRTDWGAIELAGKECPFRLGNYYAGLSSTTPSFGPVSPLELGLPGQESGKMGVG